MKRVLCCALVLTFALGCTEDEATSPFSPYAPRFDQLPGSPVVNTTVHPGDGTCDDAECTLYEAIAYAAPGATISFAPEVTGTITVAGTSLYFFITKSLTILGPGSAVLRLSGADQIPLFRIVGASGQRALPAVEIRGLTIENGRIVSPPGGGGVSISNATVSLFNVVVRNSFTVPRTGYNESYGGGIGVRNGDLALTDCTVSGNSALWGGGIHAENSNVTIAASTVSENHAISGGGGIASDGAGTLLITNSTISGNEANVWPRAGGIHNSGTATIIGSTVHDNIGAEIYQAATGSITVARSILASYSWNEQEVSICAGTIADGGYNIESGTSCGFTAPGSLSSTDPLLGPLADHGGPTHTHALLAGSAAVDLVPVGMAGCGTSWVADQRGVTRPKGVGCDAGAFEAQTYPFSGFFAPVDNLPVLNSVKAGQAVPVKFSLGGDRGLGIMAAGFPKSQQVTCDLASATDVVEETVLAAGGSSLSYDAATDTYTYVWRTAKSWANTCRRLTLQLADEYGTTRTAEFRFTR